MQSTLNRVPFNRAQAIALLDLHRAMPGGVAVVNLTNGTVYYAPRVNVDTYDRRLMIIGGDDIAAWKEIATYGEDMEITQSQAEEWADLLHEWAEDEAWSLEN